MKYFLVLLILIGFVAITSGNITYGLWVPQSPEELFDQSETVFVGTITSVNVLEFERSNMYEVEENGIYRKIIENYTQTLDEYTVNIEDFLKHPQESHTITMLEATVGGVPGLSVSIGGFEIGDRVLFYVPKIDGENQYSPESFKIPKSCDAKTVLEKPRIMMGNSFSMMQKGIEKEDNFTANKRIQFVYQRDMRTLDEKNFDFQITVRKETDTNKFDEIVLSEKINAKSNPCEWIATAKTEFIPQAGVYEMWVNITEDTSGDTFSGSFSVEDEFVNKKEITSPLKQFQSGVAINKIECTDDKVLVLKSVVFSPACVYVNSIEKLKERGWAIETIGGKAFDESSEMFVIIEEPMEYRLFYTITNSKVDNIVLNCKDITVDVFLTSDHEGVLEMSLPPKMINVIWEILVDGVSITDDTVSIIDGVLSVEFPKDTEKITIRGSFNLSGNPEKDGVCDVVEFPPYSYILR